ncbi:hypothetical protein CI102_6207 [Trichoderma harzianum]|nr:hypothetical protein CI102_6207 [Trichoderma harzianum]
MCDSDFPSGNAHDDSSTQLVLLGIFTPQRPTSSQLTRKPQLRPISQATRTTRGRSQISATDSFTTVLAALETQPEIKSKAEEVIDIISTTYPTRRLRSRMT